MVIISVVIPVYNEEANIRELYKNLKRILDRIRKEYEIIWINDGSNDNSAAILDELRKDSRNIKVIHFLRNFGKSKALSSGFEIAKGEYIITLDSDLQDDPKEIPSFLKNIKEYDVIVGWKYERKDPISKKIVSKLFNWLSRKFSGLDIHDFNCGFKILRKEVVKNIEIYGELHRYIPALAYWKGYSVGEIRVKHYRRKYGRSKYGISRLIKGALDLLTIRFLTDFATRPMHIFGSVGVAMIGIGTLINLHLVFLRFFYDMRIGDRPLLILGVMLMIIGIQFLFFGLQSELIISLTRSKKG